MADEEKPLEQQVAEMMESARKLKAMAPAFEAMNTEMSNLYFRRFNSLVKAGFTEAQAVTIIAARGIT